MDWIPNKSTEESAIKREQYLQKVCNLVDSLRSILSEAEASEVTHLIDHGEPAEGLRTLAWIIYDEKIAINTDSEVSILELIGDAIPKADLPPRFGNMP